MLNNDKTNKLHSISNKFTNLSQFTKNKIKNAKSKFLTKLLSQNSRSSNLRFLEAKATLRQYLAHTSTYFSHGIFRHFYS